jgi:hypothetical protein
LSPHRDRLRFGEAPESALREQVAKALLNKGFALAQLGRPEEAIEVHDDALAGFREAPEPALREQVDRLLRTREKAVHG